MLGDGIVSLGVWLPLATDFRYSNASAKIVSETPSLPSMWIAAGGPPDFPLGVVELDREVAGRLGDAVDRVDEVHVPGGAAELAVSHRPQPDLLLHADGL